ncbi:arylsulfatase [Algibacter agarivorans]
MNEDKISGFLVVFFGFFLLLSCSNKNGDKDQLPNIIYFLADDLGYGDVGIYGQEKIQTPNIDELARNGMLFTNHYSGAPVCAPARSVLLTGQHMGHTPIRGNDEWSERGDVWNYKKVADNIKLEGQRPLPKETVTIGNLLQKQGYKTSIFGKWGLGAPETEGVPTKQGFNYFYGYNCQRQAHNLYPLHLWENEKKVFLANDVLAWGTKLDSLANPNDSKSYKKYQQNEYAPEMIHQKALKFLEENKSHPFFMYYTSPLPHVPLQAPIEYVEKYKKIFGEEVPYIGDRGYFPNQHPRATYAAMISYLDEQLGDLILKLKDLGLYENTLIIFSSDNGPTYNGGVDPEFFNSAKPFKSEYGRTKGYLYEGGIRVPMIASWPNHIQSKTKSEHISVFYDVLPTICDIVGIDNPKGIDGISFKSELLSEKQKEHEFLYWEFSSYNGQQAVRMGKWKGIRQNIFDGNMHIELYNLEMDIKEENDVSNQYPNVVLKIRNIMKQEHKPSKNKKFIFKQLGDN